MNYFFSLFSANFHSLICMFISPFEADHRIQMMEIESTKEFPNGSWEISCKCGKSFGKFGVFVIEETHCPECDQYNLNCYECFIWRNTKS